MVSWRDELMSSTLSTFSAKRKIFKRPFMVSRLNTHPTLDSKNKHTYNEGKAGKMADNGLHPNSSWEISFTAMTPYKNL